MLFNRGKPRDFRRRFLVLRKTLDVAKGNSSVDLVLEGLISSILEAFLFLFFLFILFVAFSSTFPPI